MSDRQTGKRGRLSVDKFGYSTPVNAPLYGPPPHFYRGAKAIFVRYETDIDQAAELLPTSLELTDPAIAIAMVIDYPFSTFGPYREAIQGIECLYRGEKRTYVTHILVTSEGALAAGREIWGDPKKLAHIEFRTENEVMHGLVERPKGVRICSILVQPQTLVEAPGHSPTESSIALRVVPNAEALGPPALAQLIEVNDEVDTHELWRGIGSITFPEHSAIDPWHALPAKRVRRGYYRTYDLRSPFGRVLETL